MVSQKILFYGHYVAVRYEHLGRGYYGPQPTALLSQGPIATRFSHPSNRGTSNDEPYGKVTTRLLAPNGFSLRFDAVGAVISIQIARPTLTSITCKERGLAPA